MRVLNAIRLLIDSSINNVVFNLNANVYSITRRTFVFLRLRICSVIKTQFRESTKSP